MFEKLYRWAFRWVRNVEHEAEKNQIRQEFWRNRGWCDEELRTRLDALNTRLQISEQRRKDDRRAFYTAMKLVQLSLASWRDRHLSDDGLIKMKCDVVDEYVADVETTHSRPTETRPETTAMTFNDILDQQENKIYGTAGSSPDGV